jgi:hypothetical protein
VILFWVLLCVVIPVGLFRIGLAVVDRVRPDLTLGRAQRRAEERRAKLGRRRAGAPAPSSTGLQPLPPLPKSVTQGRPAGPEGSEGWDTLVLPPLPTDPPRAAHRPLAPTLPWFAPGTVPLTVQDRTPGPLHSTTSKGT